MGIKFTDDQEKAINEKGNILVAAAAGSGKTAVLVERVIRNIIQNKINIDEMLVVTFTIAAASEMKEKILDAIYKKIEEEKGNNHLKKQLIYISNAKISTIHSFCFSIIKEFFYKIGVSPNVKVGSVEELEILKREALDEIFEEKYEKEDERFIKYISKYAGYRDDKFAKENILIVQNFLNTIPFYKDFIKDIQNNLNEEAFFESKTFKDFLEKTKENINEKKLALKKANNILIGEKENTEEKALENLNENILNIYEDIKFLEKIEKENDWDNIYKILNEEIECVFKKWKTDKSKNENIAKAKDIRDSVREYIKKYLIEKIFFRTKEDILEENKEIKEMIDEILDIAEKYNEKYSEKKNKEKILDFSDLEILALKILVKKPENENELNEKENIIGNKYIKTDIAKKITKRFKEIQIDEYQDINTMQEYILNSISSENVFQVGDIKQSIYMFRNANPNLFLNKYMNYGINIKGKTIKLFQNFRSRNDVLSYTNNIFEEIMTKKLGGITYNKEEYLNPGFNYEEKKLSYTPELIYIENNRDIISEEGLEELEDLENIEYEAIYIKNEIQKLINEGYIIYDKSKNIYRKIQYKDIVILLRTAKNKVEIIENILSSSGIPAYTDESSGYLSSPDVNKVISYLKIIDNHTLDIDLLSVLRSAFWNFNLSEITEIVLKANEIDTKENLCIYEKMKIYAEIGDNESLKLRVNKFINILEDLKKEVKYEGISKILNKLINDMGYLNYIIFEEKGNLKKANLQLFLKKAREYEEKGNSNLKRFVNYIEKIKIEEENSEAAKVIGEDEDVVRIITMHKSKGLEYPIVFLANMNKKINEIDLKSEILLDENLGIALNYINTNLNLKYPTLLKEIFIDKKKNDIVSEELRILYVALTRAREKIYIIGNIKEYEKYTKDLEKDISSYINDSKISSELIKKRSTFLDIISIVNEFNKKNKYIKKVVNLKDLNTDNLFNEELREEKLKERIKNIENTEIDNNIKEYINKIEEAAKKEKEEEKNKESIEFLKKMSVSKITYEVKDKINYERPKILQEGKLSGKERGDLIHNIFKNMDFRKKWTKDEMKKYISNEILLKNKYNEIEKENIKSEIFENFIMSDMYKRILNAKEIKKEENFYFIADKNEIINLIEEETKKEKDQKKEKDKNNSDEEKILIQGIIDLYFIDENGKIILIDYKTDNPFKKENLEKNLIENYSNQLKIYSKILEKAYNKKIDEIYIYSTTMNKFIRI